jgi:pilus assembly protein CpaE
MQAFIVSDHEPSSARVREVLLRQGLDCPAGHLLSLDLAAEHLTRASADLVVLVLSPDPERGLAALAGLQLPGQARVVAAGPVGDSRVVLRALRAGATDYADEAEVEADLQAILARLRAGMASQQEPARVIALLAPSGGSGSSTLAANVATLLAKEHGRALLLDLKLQTGDLAALLDLKPAHTLAELCQHSAKMDRVMLERSLTRHASGVHLLAPPRTFADVAHVTAEGVRQALALARSLFPYVVADLDHSFREEQIEVLRLADVVLLVLRLDFASVRQAQRSLEYLAQFGIGPDRVRVVVNRYGQPKEVPAAKAEEALGVKVFHYIPDEPKTINRANNNGVPAVLESPRATVSRSLVKLTHGINGRPPSR